jgi:hypothetical protein
MAETQLPSDAEFDAFMTKLNAFRGGLGEGDQKILDAFVGAALGHENEDDVKAYWVAVRGPRGNVVVRTTPYATTYGAYYG